MGFEKRDDVKWEEGEVNGLNVALYPGRMKGFTDFHGQEFKEGPVMAGVIKHPSCRNRKERIKIRNIANLVTE